jgi:hypothetical protein
MADKISSTGIACEEREAGLPCGAVCPELGQVFDGLAAQLLTRGWIRGDLNGIFDLNTAMLVHRSGSSAG